MGGEPLIFGRRQIISWTTSTALGILVPTGSCRFTQSSKDGSSRQRPFADGSSSGVSEVENSAAFWDRITLPILYTLATPSDSGGSRIWPREGPTCQRGPLKLWWTLGMRQTLDPRDLMAREGHLRLRTLRGPTMSSEGPFGLLRGPLQTLRGPPYELRGSLRRSVNPFRGHKNTCWSLQTILSGTLRVPSGAERPLRGSRVGSWPHAPSGSATALGTLYSLYVPTSKCLTRQPTVSRSDSQPTVSPRSPTPRGHNSGE